MKSCSKILLLAAAAAAALLNVSFINGQKFCPISASCGTLVYPFKLDNQRAPNDCTYFNLRCNTTTNGTAVLNLPLTDGDFGVQSIDYGAGHIQLYDPGNCLFKRLINMKNLTNLNFGPLKAMEYLDFMFYVCPRGSPALGFNGVYVISCLNNSASNITVATRGLPSNLLIRYNCTSTGSWRIPSPTPEDGRGCNHDYTLYLRWDSVECKHHPDNHDFGGKGSSMPPGPDNSDLLTAMAFSVPALFILGLSCCSSFFLYVVKVLDNKNEHGNAATGPPQDTTTLPPPHPPPTTTSNTHGLDQSKIKACTELVVLNEVSGENTPSGSKNTNGNTCCSICLDNFSQKDTVRVISRCGHCFHDGCLQKWLAKNATCPVCRTCLSDS